MARWRLTSAHYLNVPGGEWEQKETDLVSGKQVRKVFPVPTLLNPDTPSDCNYPGEIIICYDGKGQGRDITFVGDPTPDMEPLDDEAEKISLSFRDRWAHPIESLAGQGGDYGQALIKAFEKQMSSLVKGLGGQAVPNTSVSKEDFAKLQEQVAALMAQNAELMAKTERRV